MKINQNLSYFSRQEPFSIHFEPENKYTNYNFHYEWKSKSGELYVDMEFDWNNIHWTNFYIIELNDSKDVEQLFEIMRFDAEQIMTMLELLLYKTIDKKKFYVDKKVNYKYIWSLLMGRRWK
jgi:hypothetical protein